MSKKKNIFIADDILIKTGFVILFLCLLPGTMLWNIIDISGFNLENRRLFTVASFFALSLAAALLFLVLGYRIRLKEKKFIAVWNILEKTLEVKVADLVFSGGVTRDQVIQTIRTINSRGLGYYVYDSIGDRIVDGRLKSQTIAINTCPSCGQSIGLTVSLDLSEVPVCRYCGSAVDVGYLNQLKEKKVELIYKSESKPALTGQGDFNLAVFCLLLFFFWPGALIYAIMKNGKVSG